MFQSIRQGQQFFILHKGENPRCDVGTVVSVSNPVPKYQNGYTAYPLPQNEMVVDVKVKVGDDTLDFQKLPANLSIADFSQVAFITIFCRFTCHFFYCLFHISPFHLS